MAPECAQLTRSSFSPVSRLHLNPRFTLRNGQCTSAHFSGRSLPAHRGLLRDCRGAAAAAAAAAAAGALTQGETPIDALKRRAQQLSTSPYDKEIRAVALPALVAMLLEPVMNAVNAGLVGHLGTLQLSAMSLGSLAVSFCTFFYTFLLFLTVPEIAAAVVKKNDDEVSCIVAKSLWIAAVCGLTSAAAMYVGAEGIVAMLKPPEADVAAFATEFIKIRSLGIPMVLLGFVATAVFRGLKDTRTPLFGALVSAAVSLSLNVLFLYALQWGVTGSAAATVVAQSVSCVLLLGALLRGGRVHSRHLRRPPPLAVMLPTLQLGAVLGARNLVSFGMVIYASALSIRLGSAYQAGFEVIRQVWLLAIQFFECLNVATQALCASYLGHEDRANALSLLNRLVHLGVGVGALAGLAVWVLHEPLIAFFTRDPAVVAHVMSTLPLICLFFPIDAAAAIMDGSLLAAKQSNYMSAVQIVGSIVQYFVLAYMASTGNVNLLNVWAALKILIVLRVLGGAARNYYSAKSGYAPAATAAPALPTPTPVAAGAEPRSVAAPTMTVAPVAAAEPEPAVPEPRLPLPQLAGRGAQVAVAAAEPLPLLPPEATVLMPSRERVAALQSIEDDLMVLACAACTSATDMKPDMLSLKQRQQQQQQQQQLQEGEGHIVVADNGATFNGMVTGSSLPGGSDGTDSGGGGGGDGDVAAPRSVPVAAGAATPAAAAAAAAASAAAG